MVFIYLYLLSKTNNSFTLRSEDNINSSLTKLENNFSNFFFAEDLIESAFYRSFFADFSPLSLDFSITRTPNIELPNNIRNIIYEIDWSNVINILYEIE